MRSTDSDNPIDRWTDQQLAEAARNTLKTLGELSRKLQSRGYNVNLDMHASNYVPTKVHAAKVVKL